MATEFDNSLHWGLFLTDTTLTSETGKYVRVSELVLSALRAAGVFSNMEDGIVAPATDKLWLDKNFDPAVLKEWDTTGASWVPMTYGRLFGRAAVDKLTVTGGTGNAVVVSHPVGFQANRLYLMTPTADNSAAATINVSGVGTYAVKYGDGSDIWVNEFKAGRQAVLFFTGIRFEVVFPLNGLSSVVDEDDMASNSDTMVPTQQSVKAYVDAEVGTSHPGFTSDGSVPAEENFWIDENPNVKIHRIRDRVFIGDAVNYNGRRNSPYGGSSLNLYGASWVEKHGRVNIYDNTGHIALLTAAHIPTGTAPGDSMGMAGSFWIVNEGNGTGGRAVYIEAMAKGSSGGTSGVELQCGNYTAVDPSVINSYSAAGQVCSAFYIGAESGVNYQVGDANDPITPATYACGAVMDISGGSLNAIYQKFKTGIVFRSTSLYRDIDGFTGNAVALGLAQGHEIAWAAASNRPKQAKIRSDVTSAAGVDVGILFKDNVIQLNGASDTPVLQLNHAASAVNYLNVTNAAAGSALSIGAIGNDTHITLNYLAKGTSGEHRFHTNSLLSLRVSGVASAVNYLQTFNAATAGSPTIAAVGGDTNISMNILGKGSGGVALLAGGAAVKFEVNATGIGFFSTTPVAAKAGWGLPTGTLSRTTYAAYAGQTHTGSYVQATVQALDDACRNVSQRLAALVTDLHQTAGYGLLRT